MHKTKIKALLKGVQNSKFTVEEAVEKLVLLPYENLEFANLDHHRALRRGFPEVVYCENKTTDQVITIIEKLANHNSVLATRADKDVYRAIKERVKNAEYNELARTILIRHEIKSAKKNKKIYVLTAGTSDIPVAEEAVVTAEAMGNPVKKLYDVGVAGIHRLLNNFEVIKRANVLIVVAGMDGALASVVSGMVSRPVIAVPTSVGYGASFKGVGPLLNMLSACSPGIAVMNIDNGFGAGYFASLINT